MKRIDYIKSRGTFINDEGKPCEPRPQDLEHAPIIANLWEAMTERGAMQAKCSICARLVGLAPRSQKMIESNPDRMVTCIPCYEIMRRLVKLDGLDSMTIEKFESFLKEVEKTINGARTR